MPLREPTNFEIKIGIFAGSLFVFCMLAALTMYIIANEIYWGFIVAILTFIIFNHISNVIIKKRYGGIEDELKRIKQNSP